VKIDKYTTLEQINPGPITTAFLAKQTELDRHVFLKVLNVQWQSEKDLVNRFKREAKICARLKHLNIVGIYDFGTTENSFYLAMEFIEGYNLSNFLMKYNPIPLDVLLFIISEVVEGLDYAHSKGVVHRDIKPTNIMIGSDGSVKISDFGLATISDLPSVTQEESTLGTPAYMSPEQALGKKIDLKSDLFSLGVTIYEMISGINPFKGENYAESIQRILNKKPDALKKLSPDIPAWISDLVESLIDKNPAKRPESSKEVFQFIQSKYPLSQPDTVSEFIGNPSQFQEDNASENLLNRRRKPKYLLYIAGIAIFFIIVAVIYQLTSKDESISASPAEEKRMTKSENKGSQQSIEMREATVDSLPSSKRVSESVAKALTLNMENKPVTKNESEPPEEHSLVNPEPGGVFILCYPWAKISIDGIFRETTPLQEPIMLSPGEYLLELTNPNYYTQKQKHTIQSQLIDTLIINLEPQIGYLQLKVIPWAQVFINGQQMETTPLDKPIALLAGKYELKLVNPTRQTWQDSIRINPGQTVTKQLSLLEK
jgi:serine/threonine-protein kinase